MSGMRVLVTGGLGFIGSALVRRLIAATDHEVLNLDRVSYSSSFESVASAAESPRYRFARVDLADAGAVDDVVTGFDPHRIMHLAAESHVDRSIDGPRAFVESNIVGTANLLEAARRAPSLQRFLHISTDEVFGSLPLDGGQFTEDTPYDPRSPYSASKASADHLVRAWGETFGLPVVITNCSNNYGPYQFPEKLIPLLTIKAAQGEPLPVYGAGVNVRDWLHVEDHVSALLLAVERGEVGRSYNVGGGGERSNLAVVHGICDAVEARLGPLPGGGSRRELITYVTDRPGHDLRYAIDSSRIRAELGWEPAHDVDGGLAATVGWYLDNEAWWGPLLSRNGGGARVGLGTATSAAAPAASPGGGGAGGEGGAGR